MQISDPNFEYERLCFAVKQMLSAMEDADNNKMINSKKMLAVKLKKQVIELMNPNKRILTQTNFDYEAK
jgi:hypothetical protein